MPSQPSLMSVFTMVHRHQQLLVKTYSCSFLNFTGGLSVNACTFLGSGLTSCWEITLPKKFLVHLHRYLFLLHFKFACLHILMFTLWSLPSTTEPTTEMSSAIPRTLRHSTKKFIFFWNVSPTGTTPNGNHMYLYLPNGKEMYLSIKIVCPIFDYDNLSLHQ